LAAHRQYRGWLIATMRRQFGDATEKIDGNSLGPNAQDDALTLGVMGD
jgi:hypothetical protein